MGNYMYQLKSGVNTLEHYDEITKAEAIARYGQDAVDAIATPIAVDTVKAQASVSVADGELLHIDYNHALELYTVIAKPVEAAPAEVAQAQTEVPASTETAAPAATEGAQ